MSYDQYTVCTDLEIASVRDRLLNGLADNSAMRRAIGGADGPISDQTLNRHVKAGMPFIMLGRQRFFDIAEVNAWLRSQPPRNAPPRRRGRPRRPPP